MTDTHGATSVSLETARELLRHLMEWDSEESWCAGWIDDNEFRLWCQVARDPVVAGELFDLPLYTWLSELAALAGGWWVWPSQPAPGPGPCFLGMSEWLPRYEEHRQKLIAKYGPEGWAAGLPLARENNRLFWEDFRQKQEAVEVAGGPSGPKPMSRETAAALLLRIMDEESEVNWAVSWEDDHEYMLWASVVGDQPSTSRGGSSEPDRLRQLATAAKGWFAWSEEAGEVEFVPMSRWLVMYREHASAQAAEPEEGEQTE